MLTDWLTWLADKAGEEDGEKKVGVIERQSGELVFHWENWEILFTSFFLTSLPFHASLSVNEFTHKPRRESDFTRSQES